MILNTSANGPQNRHSETRNFGQSPIYMLYIGYKGRLELEGLPCLFLLCCLKFPHWSFSLSLLSLFLSQMAPCTRSMPLLPARVSLGQAERVAKWTPLSRKEEGVKPSFLAESLTCPIFLALYLEACLTLPHS